MSRAVVVGSGPNGLAAALTLADAGLDVLVLEAAETPGGGTRSSELTLPGLIHDDCSAAHPLSLENDFFTRFDLTAHGLTWRWPEVQYSHPLDGGLGAAAYASVRQTAEGLGKGGGPWRQIFGPLTDHFDELTVEINQPVLHVPQHPFQLARFGLLSALPANVLARTLRSTEARDLFAGVAAHAFRPLNLPMSAAVGVVLATAAHRYGWPVAEGGSQSIARAMISALEARGGRIETGRTVTSLDELDNPEIVMLDTAPINAAKICGARMPAKVARAYRRFRHGPGAFKIEFAVEGGVPWAHEASRQSGTVHLGGSFDEIAAAEREVHQGQMPERPFVLVCQQSLADPTRARNDVHPVYTYAHVPSGYPGDATRQIEAQIERFAPGFKDRVLARHTRTTTAMAEYNPNYIGGDIITGANDPLQMVARPRLALNPYDTKVDGVFLCSAATPPGGGAHGMCGYNAANAALAQLSVGLDRSVRVELGDRRVGSASSGKTA